MQMSKAVVMMQTIAYTNFEGHVAWSVIEPNENNFRLYLGALNQGANGRLRAEFQSPRNEVAMAANCDSSNR